MTAPTPAQTRAPAASAPRPSSRAEPTTTSSEPAAELTPQEQARQMRHQDVLNRATNLLQNDATKVTQFRNTLSSFRTNTMTATAVIDSFFALFSDTTSSALGTLIREVADLYEDNSKSDALKTAWNNWRAINEDYPSLPAASGSSGNSIPLNWAVSSSGGSGSNGGAVKSNRVLKLKSSTAQSSRSSVSQARSWDSIPLPLSLPYLLILDLRALTLRSCRSPWICPNRSPSSISSHHAPCPRSKNGTLRLWSRRQRRERI